MRPVTPPEPTPERGPSARERAKSAAKSAATSEETPSVSPLELLSFALAAARRHWALGLLVAVLVGGLGGVVASAIPAIYEATAKLYDTQSSTITALLASGRHADDRQGMRGLSETVFNRDKLLSMVREAKLAEHWETSRTWPLRLKDRALIALFGPPSRKDMERALVDLLERSATIGPEDGASIRIRVYWRDPELAYALTELARRNFLEARGTVELDAITRAISLLETELTRADQAVGPAVREMQAVLEKMREEQASAKKARVGSQRAEAAAERQPSVPKAPLELTTRLEELRRAQRELLGPWQRRAAELKFQLSEQRAIYGPEHPIVLQAEKKVQASAEPPDELVRLRQEESTVLSTLSSFGLDEPAGPQRAYAGAGQGSAVDLRSLLDRGPEDPEVATARVRLESALGKSKELNARLDAARIEYATAQAGFAHRYALVEAPEVPRKPIKPKRALLYAAVVAASLLLGLLSGAVRELLSGKLLEAWQVRSLGIDVLSEIELEAPPRRR